MSWRRWALLAFGGLILACVLAPVVYIETSCRGTPQPGAYRALLPAKDRRPEARTWLTYPEWHIVYSADSLGRYLSGGAPPSGYNYGDDVLGFWKSYCAVNRATQGLSGAGAAKVMIYTIGISFSLEMLIKSGWENSIGRVAEALGGWTSPDDLHAASVQQAYGAFMHETPWYAFPFARAFSGLWSTSAEGHHLRHWERRVALSAEYGVKAGYAGLIGWASGATLGRDELTLRFVTPASSSRVAAVDPALKPVRSANGLTIVEAPRYARFSELLAKLAAARIELVEIAGNDDIFVTMLLREGAHPPGGVTMMQMPLGDRPGWSRVGTTVKVPQLLPMLRQVEAQGGTVEHVYDY